MVDSTIHELEDLRQSWSHAVTSLLWSQWLMLEAGFQATQSILATAAPAADNEVAEATAGLAARALARVKQGLAPPPELYLAPYRDRINWAEFPEWAKPSNPELYEGCAHEG